MTRHLTTPPARRHPEFSTTSRPTTAPVRPARPSGSPPAPDAWSTTGDTGARPVSDPVAPPGQSAPPPPAGPPPSTARGAASGKDRPTVSTFAALRVRNYRVYFFGQVVSNSGTWMQRIAQDWLVLSITHSPFAVGITTALQFVPMLLFGMFGGIIADRYPKRKILLVTQAAMGALAVALAALTLSGAVQVWHIYAIAFGLGLVTVVDNPTRQVFVNEMVPTRLVRNAVSLNSGSFQMARLIGPAVAGVLISAVGSGWAFGINALSFAATIGALLAMNTAELQRVPRAPRERGQVREGLRYVLERPHILWLIMLMFFVGTFGFNFSIFLSAYAKIVFDSGADVYGLLNSALAIGSVIGALLAARRATVRLAFLFASAALFSVMLIVQGIVPLLIPFAALLVVTGLMTITLSTTANSTIQLSSDPAVRGRVMSLYLLVFFGGKPLGGPLVGAMTDAWGAPMAMVVVGLFCLVATAACAALAARHAGIRLHVDLRRGVDRHLVLVNRDE